MSLQAAFKKSFCLFLAEITIFQPSFKTAFEILNYNQSTYEFICQKADERLDE